MNQDSENTNTTTATTKKTNMSSLIKLLICVVLVIVGLLIGFKTKIIATPKWFTKILPVSLLPIISPQYSNLTGEEVKLATMLETGQSGVCILTNKQTEETITYYIKGKNFRIEMDTTQDNQKFKSFIVSDNEYQYIWNNLETQGTKMKILSINEETQVETDEQDSSEDIFFNWDEFQQKHTQDVYEISCQFKNVSDEMFSPPENINFLEFDQMFNFQFEKDTDSFFQENESQSTTSDDELDEIENPETSTLELEEWVQQMQNEYDLE